jgi:hypothetical protein
MSRKLWLISLWAMGFVALRLSMSDRAGRRDRQLARRLERMRREGL